MTAIKKRRLKVLMAMGFPRNDAAEIARFISGGVVSGKNFGRKDLKLAGSQIYRSGREELCSTL